MHLVSLHNALRRSAVKTAHALSWELDERITWNVIQDFSPFSLRELQRCHFIQAKATAQDLSFHHPFLWRWAGLYLFPSELCPCTPKPSSKRCLCQVSSPSLLHGLKSVLPSSRVNNLTSCFWLLCLRAILLLSSVRHGVKENASHGVRGRKQIRNPDFKPQWYFGWEVAGMEPAPAFLRMCQYFIKWLFNTYW